MFCPKLIFDLNHSLVLDFRKESEELFKRPFKIVGSNKRLSSDFDDESNGLRDAKVLRYTSVSS